MVVDAAVFIGVKIRVPFAIAGSIESLLNTFLVDAAVFIGVFFCYSIDSVLWLLEIEQTTYMAGFSLTSFCQNSQRIENMEYDSCPSIAPFLGYMGVACAIIFASKFQAVLCV
jgi:hypothetical protein